MVKNLDKRLWKNTRDKRYLPETFALTQHIQLKF